MKTTIYYFTGTGNSLYTARLLAERLGEDSILIPMRVRKILCKLLKEV